MANSNNLKSLSDIFSRDKIKFIIPDYQRGYSWGTKQLEDLWEDLENMSEATTHYTGMFTFCPNEENPNSVFDIVDGQQRMTTLIILINELLSRIYENIDAYTSVDECKKKYLYVIPQDKEIKVYLYRFEYKDQDSKSFFIREILGIKEDNDPSPQTLYTQNLQDAKKYFADKIKNLSQEKLKELFQKVTERLKFNEYLINDCTEVYVTFETMNNRGKQLSTLEILKNRLIYLTTIFPTLQPDEKEELRKQINDTWKSIYGYLGKSKKAVFTDDAFLKDHWIMYFRYDRKTSNVFKSDLLSQYFTAKQIYTNKLSPRGIQEYINSLKKSIGIWFNINCPNEGNLANDEEKMWLTRLNHIGIGSFRPLLMAAYSHEESSKERIKLLQACERFRFLVANVTERRSNTSDSHFYGVANAYYKNPTNIDLAQDVNQQTDYWFDIQSFINSSIDRYKKREGFYSWPGLRYFLYEYERTLQMSDTDKKQKCRWEEIVKNQDGKSSIEHIYPQTPTDEYWQKRFPKAEDKALLNSLGNLLLLSLCKNIAQQNYSFDVKKKTTRNANGETQHSGYDSGSYSEQAVAAYDQWSPAEIKERGKTLLDFFLKHWEINHEFIDEEINKLLNIDSAQTPAILETIALQNNSEDDDFHDVELEQEK